MRAGFAGTEYPFLRGLRWAIVGRRKTLARDSRHSPQQFDWRRKAPLGRLLLFCVLLASLTATGGGLWWWGYFYRPQRFHENYGSGALKTLIVVQRRRGFQIGDEYSGKRRLSTFGWYWLANTTSYYPDGRLIETGWSLPIEVRTGRLADDKPSGDFIREGLWLGWHKDGNKAFEVEYRAGLKEGLTRTFHLNGKQKEEGHFHFEKMTGPWTAWYDNGQMQWRGSFLRGQPDGPWTTWHANGRLRAQPRYDQGRQIGEELVYDDRGRVVARKHWDRGFENGLREVMVFPAGTRREQMVRNDKLDGPHREFAANSGLLEEGQYAADRMQGRWLSYFSDGRPKWERHYKDDKLHGLEQVWREDGSLVSTGSYQAGDRHGHWTEWDATGNKLAEGDYLRSRRDGTWSLFEVGRLVRQTVYNDGQVTQTKLVTPD